MHSGGQFHPEPGEFSKYMMNFMDKNGVDAVIGNHPHVVQKAEILKNDMFGAYCLGNFSISPSSVYILDKDLPEYSILLHIYIGTESKKIEKISFSILKIKENKDGSLRVFPVDKLVNKINEQQKQRLIQNTTKIYNRFTGKNEKEIKIKREYKLTN